MDLYVIQEQLFFSTPKFPYVKWTPCIIVLSDCKGESNDLEPLVLLALGHH